MAGNWTKEQLDAMERDGCNILVSAAAGSGKTAVLVNRIIRKITDKENPTDVDRMVVVTFTKAAAAEMKQRIRDGLDELMQKDADNQQLQRQLTLLNNAHISTIDSFCLNIVRNYFADIDIDPVFRTADQNEIKLLENDVMEQMLEEYYEAATEDFLNLVDSYGTGRDDLRLVDIITEIYAFARSFPWEDDWYADSLSFYEMEDVSELGNNPAVKYLVNDIKSKFADYRHMYDMLVDICESPEGPKMYQAAIQSDMAGMDMILAEDDFQRFVSLIELLSFDTLGRAGKMQVDETKKEYVKGVRDAYKYFVKSVKEKMLFQSPQLFFDDMKHNMPSVRLLLKMAKDFSNRMSVEKRNRNIIDFNDMEHMALDILVKKNGDTCTYTEVADSLSEYYEEIMIDEYQDSNMLQEVILSAISRGVRGERGNMYMVGDVKQSIYKFRLACPELFIGKYDVYDKEFNDTTKNYLIELRNNFRSRKSVLEASNDVFKRLMNPQFCHIDYNDDVKLNAGLEYPQAPTEILQDGDLTEAKDFGSDTNVDIHLVTTEDEENDKKELEADAIADIIEDMFTGCVSMVYDRNAEGGYRPIRYSDIVILGRAVKQGWAEGIVNTLLSRGIPAYADAGDGYFNVREIQMVLSFLRVIDNPLQDVPMAAVMLSYFGGFNADELAVIRGKRNSEFLYNQLKVVCENPEKVPLELSKKVQKFLDMLNRYRDKSEIMSVRDIIWTVIYETGYYDYVGTMPAAERRQANLDVLLEKAAGYESTSYSGLFNFLRYIERMQKFNVEMGEASVLGEHENLVRIMTIHKSKGLEFPVVILSGMGKQINKNDAKGDVLLDQELGIGANAIYLDSRIKRRTIAKSSIASKLVADVLSEEMRVLYVAMTRAREKLIITGTVKNQDTLSKWRDKAVELEEKGRFSYTDISKLVTYFDMFMPVACMNETFNEGRFNIVMHGGEETPEEVQKEDRKESQNENVSGENTGETVSADKLQTEENGSFTSDTQSVKEALVIPAYPYPIDSAKKAKVTVSELKQMQHDIDFLPKSMVAAGVEIIESVEDEMPDIIPRFLREKEEKLAGNERGTAYHRIMECLDYSQWGEGVDELDANIVAQVADMLSSEKINKAQAEVINVSDVVAFCKSDIGRRVKSASDVGKLWREQPFVFIDKEHDETQLIQGVIDLYLVEDDGITIVDYKTDRVKRGDAGVQELVNRYKVQLDYYGKALSQLTGLSVKEKVIYSFTLGREIEV